ncbi:MAG: hypothetical protein KatS3mg108_3875 [Isosphaeraceae bacterium]|nr:MAG: hypothetical protein KatS3mg108_3875 [Isosphaeraceae bacterium]
MPAGGVIAGRRSVALAGAVWVGGLEMGRNAVAESDRLRLVVRRGLAAVIVWLLVVGGVLAADWPMLRGDARHTGRVATGVKGPVGLIWARAVRGERLGTAMEPIVAGGMVFVATHQGNVYGLRASDGEPVWRFRTAGACLHSPAYASGRLVVGSTDGRLYALDGRTGAEIWRLEAGRGGFSAAPVVDEERVYIGSRGGVFLAVGLERGEVVWREVLEVPIRQTAAVAGGRVYVTSEDLRVHAWEAATGRRIWSSEPLNGQTARDYYPVVVETPRRTFVIVRTNPVLGMGAQNDRDRRVICRIAGIDENGWEPIAEWIRRPESVGNPELWEREQQALVDDLRRNRQAQTFFVLDAETGREVGIAPVLWVGGCQGVGVMPVVVGESRVAVVYRTAYGNWNLGVAPLVGLGVLDLETNRITPLRHNQGMQPPWNTFWGTADESQNLSVGGPTIWIAHQGTLSGLDWESGELFPAWGERDTYGGFRSPPWARNEWHGPGRGSAAISEGRIYWLTGSRVLCLGEGGGPAGEDRVIDGRTVATSAASAPRRPSRSELRAELEAIVAEWLNGEWMPLWVEPGLAGRFFAFDHSGDEFEALAWAYPHLSEPMRGRVREALDRKWSSHPPMTERCWYPLDQGQPREWAAIARSVRSRSAADRRFHPFGNVHAVWWYAERCEEWPKVVRAWERIRQSFEDYEAQGWRLDGRRGDLYANRYLASLLALERIAERMGDRATAERAAARAAETLEELAAWWRRAAAGGTLTGFRGSAELDPYLAEGDAISFRIAPHRHTVALLNGLTPEVARQIRSREPEAVDRVWSVFETLYATWPLLGEERQVHSGENHVDPPDLALGGFRGLTWLKGGTVEDRIDALDLPMGRADLYHVIKLALCLEP